MTTRLHAALALAAAATLAGCIPNDASVRIFGVCAITDATCKFKPTCDALYIGGPLVVDVGNPSQSLIWPIQVDNQRPDNTTADGATNTAIAWVERLKLTYASTTPGVAIAPITVDITSSPVQPKASSVITATLVPISVAAALSALPPAQLTVELEAAGRYGDGTAFETGPFTVQVETCNGCIGIHPLAPATDPICATTDYSTTPPTITPGQISNICPQDGQSALYSCK